MPDLSDFCAIRTLFLLALCVLPSPGTIAQQPVKVKTLEVLLDVTVQDKKGRVISDLRPEEIEVLEDGVKQTTTQFRLVGSANKAGRGDGPKPETDSQTGANGSFNLVTLLFDRIDPGRAQLAREVAYNFIDNSLTENILVRVLVARQKLYLVEQFTNDKSKLRRAADRAINSTEKSLKELSDLSLAALKTEASAEDSQADANLTIAADSPLLARLSVDTILQAEKTINSTKSSSPVFSLFHTARSHRNLPGRKMVLYISNGLYLNAGLNDFMRTVVSEANLANVTFYSVDMRVLPAGAGNVSSRLESSTVINASRRTETSSFKEGLADSFSTNSPDRASSNFNVFEFIDRKKEMNKQGALADLTEATGGFLITNMNDLNGALKRAATELGSFYFLSYSPQNQEHDGKFRSIKVNILRQGLKARTRSGYFAVPQTSTTPLLDYETPMLKVLSESVVPKDFPIESALLHFESKQGEIHHVFISETSLSNFIQPDEDKEKKSYAAKFSLLAIVRNSTGEIVQKFSESHDLDIPVAQIKEAGKMNVSLVRDFMLQPGRYTIESVAHDRATNRLSARRRIINVEASHSGEPGGNSGLQTGSLYLVRQVEQIDKPPSSDEDNHLIVGRTRVVPETSSELQAAGRNEISFHLPIHPDEKLSAKPDLKIELLLGDKVVASASPALSGPDERGWVGFTAGLPVKGLPSGSYKLRAAVNQGNEHSEEDLTFNLIGGAAVAAQPAEDAKVINSTLAASDRIGELTLTALNASKPVEISVRDLIRDLEVNGIQMQSRLGDYTYSLRKVHRTLDKNGRIRSEEYKDYEAYPIRGRHALVQLTQNGSFLPYDRITIERRSATDTLIKSDETKQEPDKQPVQNAFWAAGLGGYFKKAYVALTINPSDIFNLCELSSPRTVTLDGRESIVLDFKPKEGVQIDPEKSWIGQIKGIVWIDVADKALVRIEGQSFQTEAVGNNAASEALNFIYQQQRLNTGRWSPQLIRVNSAGNENLFRGLNWDAWFEFSAFKRFDSSQSEMKIAPPAKP